MAFPTSAGSIRLANDYLPMTHETTHSLASSDEANEIELKLEVDPVWIDHLAAMPPLSGVTPKIVDQLSIYFDTPKQDLRAAGFTLRIRTAGGRHVQTIKAVGSAAAGLFARPEWEHDVAGLEPELDPGSPICAIVAHDRLGTVRPAFTVAIKRRQWLVTRDDGTVEIVADTGCVTASDRTTPVSELEFELKGGTPTAIFTLARTLGKQIPVHLGVLTKGERGYRLIAAAMLGAIKAERLELAADTTTAEAFAQIVGTCLRHFRLNENLLRRAPDAEALHQTRVALRRLRSALSLFKRAVADARFPHIASELKWLAASLGPARDIDVLRDRLGEGSNAALTAARDDAYAVALAALDSQRTRDLMIDLVEWTALGAWRLQPLDPAMVQAPAALFASAAIRELNLRIKHRGRDLDQLDDESRHQIRITAKKLRYATGFFESLYPLKRSRRRLKAFKKRLEALQDHLGQLNDLATAPALIEQFNLEPETPTSPIERETLLSQAAEAYEELTGAKRFW